MYWPQAAAGEMQCRVCDLSSSTNSSPKAITSRSPETKHLMASEQLARMKPSAYLINTARGGLIDTAALTRALAERSLAGAALDVQDPEPPNLTEPPYNDPRVIVTPHAAFVSQESLANLRARVAQQVVDRLQGRRPEHVVNAVELA
jgi:D-3-phosphoglycerate dehydrogenase